MAVRMYSFFEWTFSVLPVAKRHHTVASRGIHNCSVKIKFKPYRCSLRENVINCFQTRVIKS